MTVPKNLYRYRPLGLTGSGRVDPDLIESGTFIENALYFTSWRKFNDRFDCLMPDMSKISDAEFQEYVRTRALEEFTEKTIAEREALAKEMIVVRRPEIEQLLQESVDCLGICCFSAKPDNGLMWSHYANNHKGMCLEFDCSEPIFRCAHRVRYQDAKPEYKLTGSHQANAEAFVLTKELKWDYEDEWRIITQAANRSYPFNPASLVRVIFGLATSDRDREKVKSWIAKGPCRPRLYKTAMRKGSFALDILPL